LVVVSWVVAGLGLLLAVAALVFVRRLSKRLDALNRSYWELRYEYTRLRSQLSQLAAPAGAEPDAPPAASSSVSFVPLSTIRKKDK
jgi:hypothetical protein